jgi:N-formylglutamate deformylase
MSPRRPAAFTDGPGPLVATAIHGGHAVRRELQRRMTLDEVHRLREEDPFTADWTVVAPTRVVAHWSRFEVDLNRPRETAVYLGPDQAWGLEIWRRPPDEAMVARSLQKYDLFYAAMKTLLDRKVAQCGRFAVFDLHAYNHRRDGPDAPPAASEANPEVNVGTGTMHDRDRWAALIERFIGDFSRAQRPGGTCFDVRENVKFQGRQFPQWIHERYRESGCVLSLEVKKFFMDEWTGTPIRAEIEAVTKALAGTVAGVLAELSRVE